MRLNLPLQVATDRRGEPYEPYLVEFILKETDTSQRPEILRTVQRAGNAPLPDRDRLLGGRGGGDRKDKATVLRVQPGGQFGHCPSDPPPVCPDSRGGVCRSGPAAPGRAGLRGGR